MGPAPLFRLLGDEVRLRILRLLEAERLNVTEITAILGIAQSGVSRHLGLLKDAGLVEERRDAGFTFFRLSPGLQHGENGFGPVWPLLESHFAAAATSSDVFMNPLPSMEQPSAATSAVKAAWSFFMSA